jgi:hypothetical protein
MKSIKRSHRLCSKNLIVFSPPPQILGNGRICLWATQNQEAGCILLDGQPCHNERLEVSHLQINDLLQLMEVLMCYCITQTIRPAHTNVI